MKIYIYEPISTFAGAALVQAEFHGDTDTYKVHHPEAGYSVWQAKQFNDVHRELTAHERQLINMSSAEPLVMGISDNVHALR
jgi:hypothetical protein